MLRLSAPSWVACALLASVAAASNAGCGRKHDLGVGGSSTSASTGSGGGTTTSSATATTSTTTPTGVGGSGGTGGTDTGPTGPTELTIVDGLNDYPAIRLCFLPNETPWPQAATGLAFAAGAVVSPIGATVPTDSDVSPWVITGDLTLTAGKTCSQILAIANPDAGDGVVARPLPVIPKSVWTSNKSLLLVPHGCAGGPGHDDLNGKNACGMSYSATTPTATLALVSMSRIEDPNHVSLQVVSASAALPEVDVRVLPNLMNATPIVVAPGLTQGAIGPNPPFSQLTVNEYGALPGVQIQTYSPGTSFMSSMVPLSDVLANGGVTEAQIVNGARLVLVAVGSAPGLATGGFWHGLTYALVKAEPAP